MIEKTPDYTPQTKRLPKNAQGQFKASFTANGKEYRIHVPGEHEGFPLSRDTPAAKFVMMVLSNGDFNYTVNNLVALEGLIDMWARQAKTISDVTAHVAAWKKEVLEISKAKYLWWQYLCTVFIIGPGENIVSEWSQSEAETKIEDWSAEGYAREDFMELAALFIMAYNDASAKLLALIQDAALMGLNQNQKPSADTEMKTGD